MADENRARSESALVSGLSLPVQNKSHPTIIAPAAAFQAVHPNNTSINIFLHRTVHSASLRTHRPSPAAVLPTRPAPPACVLRRRGGRAPRYRWSRTSVSWRPITCNHHLHGFPRIVEPIRAQIFIQLREDVHPDGNPLLTIRPQLRRPHSTCDPNRCVRARVIKQS